MIDLSPLQKNSPDFQSFVNKNNPFLVSADLRGLGYALKDLITHLQKENRQEDYLTKYFIPTDGAGAGLLCKSK